MLMNKAYKISMLFDWQNGNTDLKKEHINGKGIPVVSSGVENTGIIGCTDVDARILPAHTITVDMFGNVYYRDFEYKEVTHARVFTLIPKGFELDVQTGLYFVSSLKVLSKIYSYDNMCSYAKISNMDISLPVIENSNPNHEYTVDDIDWQYMRDRITELERDRITELDAYLQATGLNDYELTEDDKKILSLSAKRASDENGTLEDNSKDEVRFGKFVIGEIFKSQNGDTDLQKTDVNGKGVPIITSGVQNNGILGLSDREAKVINANTITVDMFGNAYFRDFAYKMVTHARVFSLELKEGALSDGAGLYICSKLKHFSELFSYNNMCSFNKIKSLSIELPIKSDGTPDFDYMERYIRAMEKVVIADVVKYKDKVIETTKKVVGE